MEHGNMSMPMAPDSMYNNSAGGNSMNNDMKDMMVMHMSFFWGKDVTVLFEGWPNDRLGMYVLALFFVFFLALAVEALSISVSAKPDGTNAVVTSLGRAGVYAIRMALAYMVMLSVMSFNLGIFIVAVAGHAVGCFLVNFRRLAAAPPAETTSSNGYPTV